MSIYGLINWSIGWFILDVPAIGVEARARATHRRADRGLGVGPVPPSEREANQSRHTHAMEVGVLEVGVLEVREESMNSEK